MRGLLGSRPVSRILFGGDHPSVQHPVPRRAASAGPVRLAPDGVWLAAVSPRRWWALTPPFHPYRRRLRRIAAGGLLSVPLSVGFRRLGRPSVLPFGVRTFLERFEGPRSPGLRVEFYLRLASRLAAAQAHVALRTATIAARACRTNSPQTGHSRLAPRSSASSSCSSVRCRGATRLTAPGTPPSPCRGSARASA